MSTTTIGGARQTVRMHKPDERNREITRQFDRARPDRIVERRAEQSDDRRVDAAHDGSRAGAFSQRIPERQRPYEDQNSPGRKMPINPSAAPNSPCGDGRTSGAKISGERKKRSGDRLRRAISREKRIVADPAGRYERFAQQRQYD